MANNQRSREKRREEREAAEAKAAGADRRTRLLQLSAGGAFLAIIIVVVVIIVASGSSNSGGNASNVEHVAEVNRIVKGIPQEKLTLGQSTAPTTLYMYGDLQCPICKEYVEEFLPEIISTDVKTGKLKLTYRDFIIISEESIPAGEAAYAAGEQGKGWSFIETFYRNQGQERSGYVTEEFIESIAKAAGVPDMARFNKERKSGKFKKEVEKTTKQASSTFGFTGTPSFAIEGPKSNGIELIGTPTQSQLEERIEKAS